MSKVQQRKQLRAQRSIKVGTTALVKANPLNRLSAQKARRYDITRDIHTGRELKAELIRHPVARSYNGVVFGLSTPKHHGNSNSLQGCFA
jgi:hypothetical protein